MARTFAGGLEEWLAIHSQGRKPRSVEFNRELSAIILREWPGFLNSAADAVLVVDVLTFAERVSRYCASRYNGMVSALRFIAPAARVLKRRPLRAKERALISPEDFARLLDELKTRPRSHGALVVEFLARTGLRINEARQLRWSHVERDCLRAPGAATKSGLPRTLPFIPGLFDVIEKLRAVKRPAERVDFILPQTECQTALRRACRVLGLPRLSHHDFRHLFATRCIQSGVDLPTVARWLGHQDGGALLAKTYYHLVDEHSRRMAAKVVV